MEMLDKSDKFGNHIYPYYSHHLLFSLHLFYKSILLSMNVCKIAVSVAISADPDQTPRSAAADLGLYCLLRSVIL